MLWSGSCWTEVKRCGRLRRQANSAVRFPPNVRKGSSNGDPRWGCLTKTGEEVGHVKRSSASTPQKAALAYGTVMARR
jgi:hypothetical protein